MQNLKKVVPLFQGKKILVFGDLMLDEHIWSSVNRISPEAPVPIAEVNKITQLPEKRLVESFGGKVVVIPPIKDRSTTNLVAKILGEI